MTSHVNNRKRIPPGHVLLVLGGLSQSSTAIDHDYARARPGQPAPLQLAPLQDPKHPATANVMRGGKQVQLAILVSVSGVAEGYAVIPDQVKVTVDAGNGRHWTSAWQLVLNLHYLRGSGTRRSHFISLSRLPWCVPLR